MGWEDPGSANFPTPVVGEATKLTSFAIRVMDDLTWLKSAVDAGASGGSGANLILNGSFEAWSGGLPSGFVTDSPGQIYSGGSVTEETSDHAHGTRALKITATSPSGGAALVTDFFLVSNIRPLKFSALYKASVSTVWSKAVIYWYTAAQTASTVRTTDTIWSVQTSPTSYAFVSGSAPPPSDARYAKLMLVGGDPAGTSAGSAWFDDVIVTSEVPSANVIDTGIAEYQSNSYNYTDRGSVVVSLPSLSSNSFVRMSILSQLKGGNYYTDESGEWYEYAYQRFRIGSFYSPANSVYSPGVYANMTSVWFIAGLAGGATTIYQQLHHEGSNNVYGKVDPFRIAWEILYP